MMFQLSDDELEHLRSQFVTANISSKSRSNPYVFTEQGVYMLESRCLGQSDAYKESSGSSRTIRNCTWCYVRIIRNAHKKISKCYI